MAALAAPPAEKGTLQQRGVQAIGLRPPMLARDCDAGGMDHMRLDVTGLQPSRQPKTVAARLKGNGDAGNRPSCLRRLLAPAMQQRQQQRLARFQLLGRAPLNARNDRAD